MQYAWINVAPVGNTVDEDTGNEQHAHGVQKMLQAATREQLAAAVSRTLDTFGARIDGCADLDQQYRLVLREGLRDNTEYALTCTAGTDDDPSGLVVRLYPCTSTGINLIRYGREPVAE